MSLKTLSAEQALTQLSRFDAIIDARSEAEFALDHLPGALNWPSLNNAERHEVGTLYKQVSAFEARKRGAALVAANVAKHISTHVQDKPKHWQPLTYCWRGGQRSGSLSLVLSQIGFGVTLLEGGYKAFRNAMLADIPRLLAGLRWQVVCGTTGSGKTRLLHALALAGAQVLDLEALACHRSSVLGALPGQPQPSQKHFDMRVWHALKQLDPTRVVFVESESKKVGNVAVPDSLMAAMRAAPCLNLVLPDAQRVALLLEEYDFFVQNTAAFCERLTALTELRGHEVVKRWVAQVQGGHIASVVQDLLTQHYDPVYTQSMQRNFAQYPQARHLTPANHTAAAMQSLALALVAEMA